MEERVIPVGIDFCRENIEVPSYTHKGDAGMDIRAAEDVLLAPGESYPIPTGLKFVIPSGFEFQIRPRSGLSLKTPLRLPNSPGTIDAGYRDELMIIMQNTSNKGLDKGESKEHILEKGLFFDLTQKDNQEGYYLIRKGDRIAQLVLAPVWTAQFISPQDLSQSVITEDRQGGLGHSGHL